MKKKILFVINPVSGSYDKTEIEEQIYANIQADKFELQIEFTQYAKHAIEIAKQAANNDFDAVIAIGGDGSINEVAQGLIKSNTALGIIPFGSGNGFARHFRFPFNVKKCIEIINNYKIETIDTCTFNDQYFVNVAGLGFDAKVAHELSESKRRGLIPYVLGSIKHYFTAKSKKFTIYIDELRVRKNAYVVAVANAKQYGYGVKIANSASINDGLLNVVIINWFPKIIGLFVLSRLINGDFESSWYVDTYEAKKIDIRFQGEFEYHIDGEPSVISKNVVIEVVPNSLKIILP